MKSYLSLSFTLFWFRCFFVRLNWHFIVFFNKVNFILLIENWFYYIRLYPLPL